MAKSRKQRRLYREKGKLLALTASGKPYPVREPSEPFDERLEELQGQLAPLKAALRPFAKVQLYSDPQESLYSGNPHSGDHVYLYIGIEEGEPAPLVIADFQRAREALA